MSAFAKLQCVLFLLLSCFAVRADKTNFVVACDEAAKIYVAEWITPTNQFENFRRVGTLYDNEGELPYVRGVVVGDFNGDGYDDIVAARRLYNNQGAAHLLLNDGSNNFTVYRAFDFPLPISDWIMDGCSGDFNNDGIDDFAFNGNNTYLHIWVSDGQGGFSYSARSDLRNYGRGMDCADLNNDGILDIFRASYSNGGWAQYLAGNGDGTFKAAVDYPHTGNDPYGLVLGDFDNDGDIDRIANTGAAGDPYFYENIGPVSFAAAVFLASLDYDNHGSFDAYDFDGDGYPDIVATDYSWKNLRYFHNSGDGTFTNSVTVGTLPGYTWAVSAPPMPPLPTRPSAVVAPAVQTISAGASASFDAALSSSPNGLLVSNRWDFGDGELTLWLPATVTATSHVYAAEGHYRPRLYILDAQGYGAMRTIDVVVAGQAPEALTDALLLGEADAADGKWPVDIPITNLIYDAEGVSNYCWSISNLVDIGFEDGLADGWQAMDGTWVVTNTHSFGGTQCYRQMNTSASRTRNMLDTSIEGDFIFEVDCMAVGGTGQEIILNLNGFGWYNTYDIIIRGRGYDDLRVDRITDNGISIRYNNLLGFELTNNVPIHAEIHRIGDEITVFVNGSWIVSTLDNTWSKGRIGLGSYSCDVVFDNVKVHLLGCDKNIKTTLGEGSYDVAITAADAALQTLSTNVSITCTNDGTPPVADAGGPYSQDESTASGGLWEFALDGSGTVDADVATNELSFVWDLGTETFDGTNLVSELWYLSSAVYQTNQLVIPDQGSWGSSYAVSRQTVGRSSCTVFQARIRSTGNSMAGFFHPTTFSHTQMPYAFYFNGGYMRIYEDGAQRRFVYYLNTSFYYDVRIVLKPDQGALYYMRQADVGAPWLMVYDSDHSSATDLRRGITLESGIAYLDDLDRSVFGMTPLWTVYGIGTRNVDLIVTDPAGNSSTNSTTVTTNPNDPPVADAGGNQIQVESNAVDSVWTFSLSASNSTDDVGIFLYEWDWAYDGSFQPSGDTGIVQSHAWGSPGVYTAAVRVTDNALQADTNACVLTIVAGTPPVADPGGEYVYDEFTGYATNEAWMISLQATNSYDSESEIVSYLWCLGTNSFDDMTVASSFWRHSVDAGLVSNAMSITGFNNAWGYRGAESWQTWTRKRGLAFEARVKHVGTGYGHSMVGWRNPSYGGYSYYGLTYALYFADGGLYVYEDGASRFYYGVYSKDTWYDIRIVLKEPAGARYYIRPTGSSVWSLVYDSDYSSRAELSYGLDIHSAGLTFLIDDIVDYRAGETVTGPCYLKGTNDISLVVTDQGQNSHTNTTKLILVGNEPPVADAGPPQVQVESNAVDRVWTVTFDASASSDDHGIYLYQWDWDYDGMTFNPSGDTGVTPSHSWGEPGVYTAAVRVVDHAGQMDIDINEVTISVGAPPSADAGGPYAFDEITGNASNAAWHVMLDGTGSTDAESAVTGYIWDLGPDTFDSDAAMSYKWAHSDDAHITNGVLTFDWLAGSYVSGHYCFTHDRFRRAKDLRAETRIRFSSSNLDVIFGFKTDNEDNTDWSQWVYGLHNENGTLFYVEGSSHVSFGIPIALDTWYDWRIELKEGSGARYYYKEADQSEWILVRDSSYSSETWFRRGYHLYRGGFEADHYNEWAVGSNVTYRLYTDRLGTNEIALVVSDQALQTSTSVTEVVCLKNNPPVAAFYPSDLTLDESQAVNGIWEIPFTANLSTDDHRIYKYEWDFDYDAGEGFTPGSTSPTLIYQFSDPGTYPIALRVTDELLQQHVATGQVVCVGGDGPVAVLPGSYTVEKGWAAQFDGRASTDDSGVVRYEWDFGDGTTGLGARPRHVYRSETNVTLRLRVRDGVGQVSDWVSAPVTVITSTGPTADAGTDYTGAAGGPPVYFDGNGSTDSGDPGVIQGVARYNWDVDTASDSDSDGNPSNDVDYVVVNPFHTYASAGTYTSRLVVVDGPGQSDTNDTVVTIVADLPPDVICVPWHGNTNNPHKAVSGEPVTLKAVVRDAGALTHQWLFGDGTSSSVAAIANKYAVETAHTYTGVPGQLFEATLVVWDAVGNEGRDTYLVVIAPDDDATRADIAIDNGLWWLHKDQTKSTGRWEGEYGGHYDAAAGAALLAYQINAHKLLGDPGEDPYVETIRLGFSNMFSYLIDQIIGLQNGNDPDTNGNGIGVRTNGGNSGYKTGMVMDAIAASREFLAVAPSGANTNIKHRFFIDILTDMVDVYAWGQHDSGNMRGGWRYEMNGGADNSAAQWGAIGLLAAEDMFGINIPQFVKTENLLWLAYSRNAGLYGYDSSVNAPWNWYSTTPSAMVQLCLDDVETTNSLWYTSEDAMRNMWPIESWDSKLYYAYYAFVKAMRSARPSPVVQMHQDGLDWFADPNVGVRVKVTGQQDPDGSWYAYAQQNNGYPLQRTMSTAWAIAMLTPSLFSVPPVAEIDAPAYWPYGRDLLLDGSGSYHPDDELNIVRYSWDLNGDGIYTVITNEPYALINMPDPGTGDTYVTIKLRVTDDNSPAVSSETFVTIRFSNGPFPPFAEPGDGYEGYAEVPFAIDGSASWDLDGDNIVLYMWDFNYDGTNDLVTSSPTAQWMYDDVGEYAIALRVVDDGTPGINTSDWEFVGITIEEPPLYPLPVGLDSTNRIWTTGGDGVWTGQIVRTHDTIDAGGSPVITNLESAWFESTFDGPGTVTFWWKTSSEELFDWLYFYDNGTLHGGISGDTGWEYMTYYIADDELHTLRWEYRKDKTVSAGRDEGYVDQVNWFPGGALSGFSAWLDELGLTGVSMSTMGTDDHIAYGFEYALGFSPSVSNDVSLLAFAYDSGGIRFVDTPPQDPDTIPYIDYKVKATTNLLMGTWPLELVPTNHPSVPGGREWWSIPNGYPVMFFKLWADEK